MVIDAKEPTAMKLCICCHDQFSADLVTCPKDGTTLSSLTRNDLVATVLDDRYEILNVIGGGGMGLVYRGKHRFMNRTVAIKVLHKSHHTDQATLKRFQLEAQAASALSNPNIVTIYDFGTSPTGEPYMVMDLLEGRSLADILEAGEAISMARALNIFIQVCRALEHAHSKGIIHRDIKPSNIMLVDSEDQSDLVKVVDFGIAKLLDTSGLASANLTRTGEVFGSPMYMSPEQWQGLKLDARVDVYAFGAVMYKVLARKNIFEDGDMLRLMYKHVSEMPVPFVVHDVAVAPELEAIVFKALAKEPNDRFQSMNEMIEALDQVKGSSTLPARVTAVPPVSCTPTVSQPLPPTATTTPTVTQPLVPSAATTASIASPDMVSTSTVVLDPGHASNVPAESREAPKERTIQISIPRPSAKIAIVSGISVISLTVLAFGAIHFNSPAPVVIPQTSVSSPHSPPALSVPEVSPPPTEKAAAHGDAWSHLEERKRTHSRHPLAVKAHSQHPTEPGSSNHIKPSHNRGISKLKKSINGIKRILDSL